MSFITCFALCITICIIVTLIIAIHIGNRSNVYESELIDCQLKTLEEKYEKLKIDTYSHIELQRLRTLELDTAIANITTSAQDLLAFTVDVDKKTLINHNRLSVLESLLWPTEEVKKPKKKTKKKVKK